MKKEYVEKYGEIFTIIAEALESGKSLRIDNKGNGKARIQQFNPETIFNDK